MSENPQVGIWNEGVGGAWTSYADQYDATLEPFSDAVFDRLTVGPDHRVVDIGCGTGATSVRLAGAARSVLGVDLSVPMLELAAQRASDAGLDNLEFAVTDVEAAPFGSAVFDVAFSRFGVMFFLDPVRAFSHIHQSLVAGGQLGFVCFQSPFENPFILVPIMAGASQLPGAPGPPAPGEPSPFALADPARTTSILTAAGFTDVSLEPGPTSAMLGPADELEAVARRVLEQNPNISPTLAAAAPEARAAAIAATAAALGEHVVDGQITLGASTWVVTATAG
jgi:SAM-dependent methyltransferase